MNDKPIAVIGREPEEIPNAALIAGHIHRLEESGVDFGKAVVVAEDEPTLAYLHPRPSGMAGLLLPIMLTMHSLAQTPERRRIFGNAPREKQKTCPNCGTVHYGRNLCCSSGCSNELKQKQKVERKLQSTKNQEG